MIADDLLDIARRLAAGDPTQSDLRRAISSIYYVVFHAICQSNADTLVGDDPDVAFSQQEVVTAVTQVESAITDFRAVPAQERRAFAVFVLMRERQE